MDDKLVINGVTYVRQEQTTVEAEPTQAAWEPPFYTEEPKLWEVYYFVSTGGEVVDFVWNGTESELCLYQNNILFKTEEAAKEHASSYSPRRQAQVAIEKFIALINEGWEPDWKDHRQEKYYTSGYNDGLSTVKFASIFYGQNRPTWEYCKRPFDKRERETLNELYKQYWGIK